MVKESACNAGDVSGTLGWEDPLEEEMATHSSAFAWRIPWTEEPGGHTVHRVPMLDMTEQLSAAQISQRLLEVIDSKVRDIGMILEIHSHTHKAYCT